MTTREWNLIKEAVARTRCELDNRVPPGPQDSWRNNRQGEGVKPLEATQIRAYVRAAIDGNRSVMRHIGQAE
jgi:hypothetical protein